MKKRITDVYIGWNPIAMVIRSDYQQFKKLDLEDGRHIFDLEDVCVFQTNWGIKWSDDACTHKYVYEDYVDEFGWLQLNRLAKDLENDVRTRNTK